MKKVKVTAPKKAAIRRNPEEPGNDEVVRLVQNGYELEIDEKDICFDWCDRKFYRTVKPKGWIHEGVIDYGN